MSRHGYIVVKAEDQTSLALEELVLELVRLSTFYGPIIQEALPRMEDDGGPVYDEEERRTKCQAISS